MGMGMWVCGYGYVGMWVYGYEGMYMYICGAVQILFCLPSDTCTCTYMIVHWDSDSTYRVILRIVKDGCHPVAIAQVVEH